MDTKDLLLEGQILTFQAQICILNDLMENTFGILKHETDQKKIKDAGILLSNTRLKIIKIENQLKK